MVKLYEVLKKNPLEALVFLQDDWYAHFKDKEQINRGLDLLLLIFKDLLYIQLGKQEQTVYVTEDERLEQYALQTSGRRLAAQMAIFWKQKETACQYESTAVNGTACLNCRRDLQLYNVVGVRFKKAGKIYYFDPGDLAIQKDDYVIVETVRGIEYGKVVIGPKEVDEKMSFFL